MDTHEIFNRLLTLRQRLVSDKEAPLSELECAIFWDVAQVLGLSDEQAGKLAGDPEPKSVQPEPELNPADYEITNGYVGGMGISYTQATRETLNEAIAAAATRNGKTGKEIARSLEVGNRVAWCDSPNFYYDHSVGYIRRKHNTEPAQLVECDCGHSVPAALVMNASLGRTCPDCYDDWSG